MKLGFGLTRELIIDIGSSHTVVVPRRNPRLLRAPSRVSIAPEPPGRAARGGAGAARSARPAPEPTIVYPVRNGRVVEVYAMEQLLRALMKQAGGRWPSLVLRTLGVLLVRPDTDEQEAARLRAMLVDVGFSRTRMVPAPFAAAHGCGLPVHLAEGQMVVDFGGGQATFAIFSLGGLAAWWREEFGSQALDAAIAGYIAQRYKRKVTLEVGEQVKLQIGSVFPMDKPAAMEVIGLDQRTEDPKRTVLEDNEIRDVLVDRCEVLLRSFQKGFEGVPPEIAGDIARNGITLVGGGSLLRGLPNFLRERTGLDFRLARDPMNVSVWGARGLLKELEGVKPDGLPVEGAPARLSGAPRASAGDHTAH